MARVLAAVAALAVAVVAHAAVFYYFVFGTCAISDTADTVPARASAQGQVCRAVSHLDAGLHVAAGLLVVSGLLAVVLAVRWWGSPRRRVLGLTACLWLPLLVSVASSAPSDSCSESQRRELPAYECTRASDT